MQMIAYCWRSLFCVVAAIAFTSCSLYESTGRKAIEDNENGIVGAYSLNTGHTLAYHCLSSSESPAFLHEPLEAITTPYEAEDMTTLLDTHATPIFLAMAKMIAPNQYVSCKVRFLTASASTIHNRDIAKAAQLGHEQIVNIEEKLQRGRVRHGQSL